MSGAAIERTREKERGAWQDQHNSPLLSGGTSPLIKLPTYCQSCRAVASSNPRQPDLNLDVSLLNLFFAFRLPFQVSSNVVSFEFNKRLRFSDNNLTFRSITF